jgi:predicted flap endonuclease-1-like 5' DNA nuclease
MDTLRRLFNNPVVVGIVCVVLGLIIGGIIIGYWLWPVHWYAAAPNNLNPVSQQNWLRAAIDSFAVNQDASMAQTRYQQLGADAPTVLAAIQANPGNMDPAEILAYSSVVAGVPVTDIQPPRTGFWTGFFIMLLVIALIFLLIWIFMLVMRSRTPAEPVVEKSLEEEGYTPIEASAMDETAAPEAADFPATGMATAAVVGAALVEEPGEETPLVEEPPIAPVLVAEEAMPEPAVEAPPVEVPPAPPDDEQAKMSYDIAYVEGIGPVYADKLKAVGVATPKDLLEKGATPKGRADLALETGISDKLILRWVNHVDLYRIKGIGSEYADLLEATGVDTVVELATRNPANLYQKLVATNMDKHLVRKVPFPSQVDNWIEQAKALPRAVSY